jgi:hypothetical protein
VGGWGGRERVSFGVDAAGRGMVGFDGQGDFLMDAQLSLEAMFPGVLEIEGVSVPVAVGGNEWQSRRIRGGFDDESEARVRVRMSLLAERPAKGVPVVLDGRRFTVDEVAAGAPDVAWSLALKRDGGGE